MKISFSIVFDRIKKTIIFSALITCVACTFVQKPAGETVQQTLLQFIHPSAEFRSVPLWVWNDAVSREEIEIQLRDFKEQGIGGVFIHPRPGLSTPYLSDEWLALCRYAVETGKTLGLKVWLYDENSYPSGFAGGHVPAVMPDALGKGLRLTRMNQLPGQFENRPLLVLKKKGSGFMEVTETSGPAAAGDYYVFDLKENEASPWFGGFNYVDIMRPEVTEKFLNLTLEAYRQSFGEEFGHTVPGSFQDEAHIAPVSGSDTVNFTPQLFFRFHQRWGYDLRPHLPELFEESGDWQRTRHNYYQTLLELFIEGWAKPYYDYCERNHLALTGHYWEHEWPEPRRSPDTLAMAGYAHIPGIDCLMNEWQNDPHAQFGNSRAVREIRSAANQLGRKRTLCETYGAGGWDMGFADQKRIGDWLYALGVNLLDPHLSYMTIQGARKRDHPLSFSYHEPWWAHYRTLADYFGRLSVALSAGEQLNRIVVLEPTTTAWMLYSPTAPSPRLEELGNRFQNFIHELEKRQVEYDLASEKTLEEHGSIRGHSLVVGRRPYDLLILPPGLKNLNQSTLDLLAKYLRSGGKLLCWEGTPTFVDGQFSDEPLQLARTYAGLWRMASGTGFEKLAELSPAGVRFEFDAESSPLLFHQRRLLEDGQILFLANSDSQRAARGLLHIVGGSMERWDPFTGQHAAYPFTGKDGELTTSFELPVAGSLLLVIRPEKGQSAGSARFSVRELEPETPMRIEPLSAVPLTLDYCDIQLAGKIQKDLYFYDAQQKIFQHHGLARNPWDSSVQFKRTILDLDRFPANSGFSATYWFTSAPGVDLASLQVVAERPEFNKVEINGHPVLPEKGRWWLDRAFGVYQIGAWARAGKNQITLNCKPFRILAELEPIYLLGNFRLKPEKKGFSLIPAGELKLGPWKDQGMPFYADRVCYTKKYRISHFHSENNRITVALGGWSGSLAEVRVNDKPAGIIAFPPYELDISPFVNSEYVTISVIVYGTLKNLLGPHHNNPPLGRAWPGSFQKGAEGGLPPGSEYSLVGYGLFSDFRVNLLEKK